MRKTFLAIVAIAAPCLPAAAQYTTITASNIADVGGALLANGQIHFTPTQGTGALTGSRLPGGGQGITRSVDCLVTNGAITTSVRANADGSHTCRLADTASTNPAHLCYQVSITDSDQFGQEVQGPGYGCYQPTGITDNFDGFIPNNPAIPIQTLTGGSPGIVTSSAISAALGYTPAAGNDPRIVNAVSAPLPGSPTAVYQFNETAGQILDTSGNGNNISYTGGATRTAQGVQFTAAGQQIVTPITGTYQTAMVCFSHQTGPLYVTNPATDMSAYFEPIPTLIGTTNQTGSTWLAGATLQGGYIAPAVVNPAGGYTATTTGEYNGGPHCMIHVRSSTEDSFYMDGSRVSPAVAGASSSLTMQGNTVFGGTTSGSTASTSNWFWGTFHYAVLWPVALTPAQVVQAETAAANNLISRSLPAPGMTPAMLTDKVSRLLLEGNSIGACAGIGTASNCWNLNLSLSNSTLASHIVRVALGGTAASFMTASQGYRENPLLAANAGYNVALLWDGINDGCRVGKTVDQQWGEQVQWSRRMHSVGVKTIIGTMIDDGAAQTCGGGLTPAQYKAAYNSLVRGTYSLWFDGIADFAANPTLGADGASSSATYFYSDHVHPIDAAQPLIASIASTAINQVMAAQGSANLTASSITSPASTPLDLFPAGVGPGTIPAIRLCATGGGVSIGNTDCSNELVVGSGAYPRFVVHQDGSIESTRLSSPTGQNLLLSAAGAAAGSIPSITICAAGGGVGIGNADCSNMLTIGSGAYSRFVVHQDGAMSGPKVAATEITPGPGGTPTLTSGSGITAGFDSGYVFNAAHFTIDFTVGAAGLPAGSQVAAVSFPTPWPYKPSCSQGYHTGGVYSVVPLGTDENTSLILLYTPVALTAGQQFVNVFSCN